MSNRDEELDALLKPLRESFPNFAQMHAWRRAVESEVQIKAFKITRSRMVMQMVAAMLVGVMIGAVLVGGMGGKHGDFEIAAQNFHSNATFEYYHANLD